MPARDLPAHPNLEQYKKLAKDLVKGMAEQGLQWKGPVHLAQKVIGLRRTEENGKLVFTIVTDQDEYPGRTVLIAGGIGAFTPRKLPLKDVDQWNDKGLHDRVLNPREFAGKRILIVGGGDSAFDWAVNLHGIARSIVMIHRRDGFRAHQATVDQVQALSAAGVTEGDRVAAFMPNMPETIIFMLATTSLGAIWSSCSPDFGAQGVLDRFGQITPKVLFAVEGYRYNGKTHDTLPRLAEIASARAETSCRRQRGVTRKDSVLGMAAAAAKAKPVRAKAVKKK